MSLLRIWWIRLSWICDALMIHTRHLTKDYGPARGIVDVTLHIPPGESWAVIGPSGCGKTTLLHTLAGLIRPDGGTLDIGGEGECRIGLVQQRDALFPWLTLEENVSLGIPGARRREEGRKGTVRSLLAELGLSGAAGRYPRQVSGGERQRASFARSLVQRPDLLLLDEPTSSLDAITRESLQSLLLRILTARRLTSLLVTHSIEEALLLGRRVLVMGQGRIRSTLDNPAFPDPAARDTRRFYEDVLRLREFLREASAL